MKKKLAVLVTLVVGVVLVTYYFHGKKTEACYHQGLAMVEGQYPLNIKNVKYKKGLFRSSAVTRVQIDFPDTPAGDESADSKKIKDISFDIEHEFYHGPFFVSGVAGNRLGLSASVSHIRFQGEVKKIIDELFKDREPLTLTSFTGFDRETDVNLEILPFNYRDTVEKMNVSSEKVEGNAHVSAGGNAVTTEIYWPGMKKDGGEEGDLIISGVSIVSDQTRKNGMLWMGKNSVTLKALNISNSTNQAMKRFELGNMEIIAEVYGENDLVNLKTAFSFENMGIDNSTYGPGTLIILLRNLEEETIIKLAGLRKEIQKLQAASGPDATQDVSMMYYSKTMELLPQFMAKGPMLEIKDLNFKAPAGTLKGDATAVVDASRPELLANPLTMLSALKVNVNLDVPLEFIENTLIAPQVQALAEGGMVTIENNMALLRAEFANNQISFNGVPLPLTF